MLVSRLAETSRALSETSARLAKVDLLAAALREAEPAEVPAVVGFLTGELTQRQIGVGWAALRDLPAGGDPGRPTLTVAEVDAAFGEIGARAGKGSQAARRALLAALFDRATPGERDFLVRLLLGDLRQGALEGVMADAVARAAGLPVRDVRRALMLSGRLGEVAATALGAGAAGLARFRLQVGRPLLPMLAGTAGSVPAALERIAPAGVEWKLDGVRVQVHRDGDEVAVFTRTLDDVTARVPEIVAAARALPASSLVLDGEAIALRPDGRPYPFQDTASRFARQDGAPVVALTPYLFDVLHRDGEDLLDLPCAERVAALADVVPEHQRVPREVAADAAAAEAFFAGAVAAGHEGVMVKSLDAPYEAGRRGSGWLKVKPVHTLDLVVLAAEWGHGRRQGWLSNLHLGARDPATGGFVMLGKTFKGLTDVLLTWQTAELLAREVRRTDWVVYVRPELVVEIAFDGVQRSPRYPGKVALRFARVLRYRPDKTAAEADTLDTVLSFLPDG
ncbi:MAG: ATP-dependent DNA ligase [Mycobacteriales bacterium]